MPTTKETVAEKFRLYSTGGREKRREEKSNKNKLTASNDYFVFFPSPSNKFKLINEDLK